MFIPPYMVVNIRKDYNETLLIFNRHNIMIAVQITTVFSAIILIAITIRRIRNYPNTRWLKFPVLFWAFHIISFYIYVALRNLGIYSFPNFQSSDWSSVLRLHGIITYLFLEFYGLLKDKDKEKEIG